MERDDRGRIEKEEMNDEYVLTYFFGKSHKRLDKSLLENIPKDISEYLCNRYSDSSCILETIERIKKKIDAHPLCECCGKPVKYVGSTRMFLKSCGDPVCEKVVNSDHCKATSLKKYGVDNPAKSDTIKEKTRQTNIERYGHPSPLLDDAIKEKTRTTNLGKYGCETAQSSDEVKTRMSNSNKAFWNTVDKEPFVNSVKSKIEKTCIEKYGVSNPMKVKELHDKILPKIQDTKRKNNTFNTSTAEDESYVLLKGKFNDVKRNYKSEQYPFSCDFYIPSIDTYIECNYHWTHGGRPYNKDNIECNGLVEAWKSKGTKYYANAVNTYTIRDVNKRKTAKENNLNWFEFFDINSLKEWLLEQ